MIIGIGTDIIEIKRIIKANTSKSFKKNTFTKDELEKIKNPISLAGNFAGKEAVAKAFGTGFSNFYPNEIEILRDNKGKPYINLYKNAKLIGEKLGVKKIHISISHSKENAIAFVVLEG